MDVIEDAFLAIANGDAAWREPGFKRDTIEALKARLLEFLVEAESRALEFDHVERAGEYRRLHREIELLP